MYVWIDNDFGFSYKGIWLYYGRKSGWGGYGPPDGWMRGSRIGVLKEGQRGLAQSWIRQDDGSRMDQAACSKFSKQPSCCGTSTVGVTSNEYASYDIDALSMQLNRAPHQLENKCAIYEAAYRKRLAEGVVADDHTTA